MTVRDQLDRFSSDLDGLVPREKPRGWEHWSRTRQLEYIADLLIAGAGGHRAANILSWHSYKRRLRREVYSTRTVDGDLSSLEVPITHGQGGSGPGVFGRAYRPNPRSSRHQAE